jgi:hypothetical protein
LWHPSRSRFNGNLKAMRARLLFPSLALVGLLSGCAGTVALKPADAANDPACAEVMVRLPDTVAGLDRRSTNAQSTAAWGSPAAVILRCGLPDTGPSALPCFTVDDVDWLRDDASDPNFTFFTYGRNPVIEVLIDSTAVSGTTTLSDLSNAVGTLKPLRVCTDATDVLGN